MLPLRDHGRRVDLHIARISKKIRDRDGKKVVLIAYDGKAVARQIRVLSQRSEGYLVDGLVGGESVITTAPQDLKDGDKIKIKGQS